MGSASMYLQAVGRGARPSPMKTRFLVLDLAGISHLHGHPQEDRIYSLDGKAIRRAGENPGVTFCRVCAAPMQPGEACPICEREWDEAKPIEVTKDPLEKFARFRTDDEATRAQRLAKWIKEARSKGQKWQSAMYRFKGTYQAMPPAKIVSVALELAKTVRGPM
jgi:superfamily II DNA or RNA helicase